MLKTASGATVATYDAATSANLSISGSTLTIDPAQDLSAATAYTVELGAGVVKDLAGNGFAGSADYNFSTVNSYPPQDLYLGELEGRHLHLISPYVTASGKLYYIVDANNNGYMDVQDHKDLGDHVSHVWMDNFFNGGEDRFDTQPNGAVAGVDDARTAILGGLTLVNPTTTEIVALRQEMNYAPPAAWFMTDAGWMGNVATATRVSANVHHNVSMTSTTIYTNLYDGYYNGVWVVEVLGDLDLIPPTITTFSPVDEATGVVVGSNIVLTFSEPIQRGTGQIVLKTVYGAVEGVYEVATSANLSISGNTLTIDPSSSLGAGRGYRVEFAPGSVKDLAGNAYVGTTAYNFTVEAAPAMAPSRWSGSGHFYQWASAPSATPDEVLTQAQEVSYRGLKGYLGTITSAAENQFVVDMMVPVRPYLGLSGGVIFGASDQAVDGQWKWLSGPESGAALSYLNWSPSEPTVMVDGLREDFVYVMVGDAQVQGSGWWADISSGRAPGTNGYLIEYGGLPASYSVSAGKSTVDEGSSVTFTIDTTNVEWGTALSYTLSGISQSDLSSGALTGTAIVQQRDTDGRATVTVQLAADQTTEGIETLTLTVEGVSASVEVVDISPIAPANGMSGIAYHWKSHTLLDKVAVQAVDQEAVSDTPTQLFDLRAAALDQTTGKLTVEVWANPGATVETIDFTASGPTGSIFTFTSTLGADWTPLTNTSQPGQLLLGAYLSSLSATGLTVPTQVGTLEVQLAVGATDVQIAFSEVQVGTSSVPDLALGMAGTTTGTDGAFAFTTLPAGSYDLNVTRPAGDGSNGVTSADALAALRLAVGINPNTDPDGAGPQEALKVSPYQFMAADANQDGKVSAADALAILRMAVKLPTAVPQEWFFVEETRDLWNESTGQSALTRTNAAWDRSISSTAPGEVNLVGVLKGDVNGSWIPPTGAQDLDLLEPGYLADLAQRISAPMDQFGVYSGG